MAHDLEKKWRSKDVMILENADFASMLLCDRVLSGLAKSGFKKPSPIQLEAIPTGRFGKDLLVQAKSGTGKTLVFVIVALEMLHRKLFRPQVLILVPTREIATQICSVIKTVGSYFSKLRCESFIGGLPVADDIKKAQNCQIAVGTPGRIKQLISLKALCTNSVRLMVFDEADELLAYSWQDDIDGIFNSLPEDKQVIATSATYPPKLKKIMFKYLKDPYIARLDTRKIALLGIIHYVKIVESSVMPLKQYDLRLAALEPILKTLKFTQCLVYCNGIHKVETLYRDIKKWGFSSTYISSNRDQSERLKAIDCLKRFKCKVLVSSDVTARGIDAENVDLVVNFDISNCIETYLHRSGRAGRYGTMGVTISLVDKYELKNYLGKIERAAQFKSYLLPDPLPVDLIQNPSIEKYAIEISQTDDLSEDEGEKRSISSNEKRNKVFYNWKNAIAEGSAEDIETQSKCPLTITSVVSDADSEKQNGFSEAASVEMSSPTNGTSENKPLSHKLKSQSHSHKNCEFSTNESLKDSSICEDLTESAKSDDVSKSEFSMNDSLKDSSICEDLTEGAKSYEVKSDDVSKSEFPMNESLKDSSICEDLTEGAKSYEVKSDDVSKSEFPMNESLKDSSICEDLTECAKSYEVKSDDVSKSEFPMNESLKDSSICEDLTESAKSYEVKSDDVSKSEFSMKESLKDSSICEDLTESAKSFEVKSDDVSKLEVLNKNSLDFNCMAVSSEVSNSTPCDEDTSSVILNECIRQDVNNVSLPENDCVVYTNEKPCDINAKVSLVQTIKNENLESTFPGSDLSNLHSNETDFSLCGNEMSRAVENFVNNYEANKDMKMTVSKSMNVLPVMESSLTENSERKSISTCFISDLNSRRSDYYCKVFKLFQEDNACNSSEGKMQEILNETENIHIENELCVEEKTFSSRMSNGEKLLNLQEISNEPEFVLASDLTDKLKPESIIEVADDPISESSSLSYDDIPDFYEIPNLESTPHCDKSKYKVTTLFDRSSLEQPVKNSMAFFDEMSEESGSKAESGSDEKSSLDTYQCSPSRDSESESESCSDSSDSSSLTSSSVDDDSSEECTESFDGRDSHNGSEELSSSTSSAQKFRCKKKIPLNLKHMHSASHLSTNSKTNQQPYSRYVSAYQKMHHYSHSNACPESTYQHANHSVHFPAYHHPHNSICSECKQHESRRKRGTLHKGAIQVKNHPCSSDSKHSSVCFMPSEHRCHPCTDSTICNQRAICGQWYQIFYDQWLHIQRHAYFTS